MRKPATPRKPIEPTKPSELVVQSVSVQLHDLDGTRVGDFANVVAGSLPSYLTAQVEDWNDIVLDYQYGYDTDGYVTAKIPCINGAYEKQLKRYEKSMITYERNMVTYREKMITYSAQYALWEKAQVPKKTKALEKEKKSLEKQLSKIRKDLAKLV